MRSNADGSITCGSGANDTIPASQASAYANFPQSTSSYRFDAAGNIVVPMASGQGYYTITPGGTLIQNTGAAVPSSTTPYNSGLASQQQAALINTAVSQGIIAGVAGAYLLYRSVGAAA